MSDPGRKRHPIRGLICGLLLGLGLALLAISYSIAPFGGGTVKILVGVGALLGLVVGLVGPTRRAS